MATGRIIVGNETDWSLFCLKRSLCCFSNVRQTQCCDGKCTGENNIEAIYAAINNKTSVVCNMVQKSVVMNPSIR